MKISDRLDAVIHEASTDITTLDEITHWCQSQIRKCRAVEFNCIPNTNGNVTDGTQVVTVK